jgi:hypothetical protein
MAERKLSDLQKKFLEVLDEEAAGDMVVAKKLAGYSPSTPLRSIIASLKDELVELARTHLATNSLKAARAMTGALVDPTELGIKEKMRAAEQILDRVGVTKTENIKIEGQVQSIILLPPKD